MISPIMQQIARICAVLNSFTLAVQIVLGIGWVWVVTGFLVFALNLWYGWFATVKPFRD